MTVAIALLVALAVGLPAAGYAWQHFGEKRDRRRWPASGTFVDSEGGRVHTLSMGEAASDGSPTVVFEAALGGSSLSFCKVQPRVAECTTAFAYDRPGHGASGRARTPRTIDRMAGELAELLERTCQKPPFILVGHSFGALVVERFAARFPKLTAGLVLVDPADPMDLQSPRQAGRIAGGAWLAKRGAWAARFGVARAVAWLVRAGATGWAERLVRASSGGVVRDGRGAGLLAPAQHLPPELQARLHATLVRPAYFLALADTMHHLRGEVLVELAKLSLPDFPVTILSAANTAALNEAMAARLAPQARCIVLPDAGHWLQLEQPATVTQAIVELVEATRSGSSRPEPGASKSPREARPAPPATRSRRPAPAQPPS